MSRIEQFSGWNFDRSKWVVCTTKDGRPFRLTREAWAGFNALAELVGHQQLIETVPDEKGCNS